MNDPQLVITPKGGPGFEIYVKRLNVPFVVRCDCPESRSVVLTITLEAK